MIYEKLSKIESDNELQIDKMFERAEVAQGQTSKPNDSIIGFIVILPAFIWSSEVLLLASIAGAAVEGEGMVVGGDVR